MGVTLLRVSPGQNLSSWGEEGKEKNSRWMNFEWCGKEELGMQSTDVACRK